MARWRVTGGSNASTGFQAAPEGFDAMILSPRAGGVGLTLTRANHVIHLSRWWNPASKTSARAARSALARAGLSMSMSRSEPLGDGRRSFDQNLHDLLERKRRLMRDALLPVVWMRTSTAFT